MTRVTNSIVQYLIAIIYMQILTGGIEMASNTEFDGAIYKQCHKYYVKWQSFLWCDVDRILKSWNWIAQCKVLILRADYQHSWSEIKKTLHYTIPGLGGGSAAPQTSAANVVHSNGRSTFVLCHHNCFSVGRHHLWVCTFYQFLRRFLTRVMYCTIRKLWSFSVQ